MKKNYFTLLFVLGTLISFGQDLVPNGSFENGSGNTITGWSVTPDVSRVPSVNVTNGSGQTTTLLPASGNSMLFLKNSTNLAIAQCNRYAYNQRPNSMRFQFAFFPAANNSERGVVVLLLSKWDSDSSKRDTINLVSVTLAPTSSMTDVSLDLTTFYLSGETPDSATILLLAGIPNAAAQNSSLLIDDIKLSSWMASKEELSPLVGQPTIVPNPIVNNAVLNYEIKMQSDVVIGLYDINGRLVNNLLNETQPQGNHSVEINRNNLPVGIYFAKITTDGYTETVKIIIKD